MALLERLFLRSHVLRTMYVLPRANEITHDEHEVVLAAIADGDEAGAQAAMLDHLAHAIARMNPVARGKLVEQRKSAGPPPWQSVAGSIFPYVRSAVPNQISDCSWADNEPIKASHEGHTPRWLQTRRSNERAPHRGAALIC